MYSHANNMTKNILLIDDDEDELEIFNLALKSLPYQFHCWQARNPQAAYELAKEARADFVFIDFNMPKTNGLQVLEDLKNSREFRDSLFILYSNFIDNTMMKNATEMGAYACMKKPNLTSTLAERLRELLLMNRPS